MRGATTGSRRPTATSTHGLLLPLKLLVVLLLVALPTTTAFVHAPTSRVERGARALQTAAANGEAGVGTGGGTIKGQQQQQQLVVVVVGDRATRLFTDLWAPGSVSIEHPQDARFLEVCVCACVYVCW